MTETQIPTCFVSVESIIKDPYFKRGFKDVKRGRPFDPDLEVVGSKRKSTITRTWNYERGRQFAYMFDGELIKDYKVSYDARMAWIEHWQSII